MKTTFKEKLTNGKNKTVKFCKENSTAIAATAGVLISAVYVGVVVKSYKETGKQIREDAANGFLELGEKKYKLGEDGDFITVDEWNEHIS